MVEVQRLSDKLTITEIGMLRLKALGLTDDQIADTFDLALFTTKKTLGNAYDKLGVNSDDVPNNSMKVGLRAVLSLVDEGLIDPGEFAQELNLDDLEKTVRKSEAHRRVLDCLVAEKGLHSSNREIAESVGIVEKTVKNSLNYTSDVLEILGTGNRIQLAIGYLAVRPRLGLRSSPLFSGSQSINQSI